MPKPPANATRFKRLLLRWFRACGRDLPWRLTRDPYRVLVSEFMLQQTQVPRVRDFYQRFLARFPSLTVLADARPSAVREAWEGLGYYRRAANLHALARTVVSDHGGCIPDDPTALERLPGVGRYTAGAVASFAYERRVPAVDTNAARVLRRAFKPRLPSGARGQRALQGLATRILPSKARTVWEFNQALMDLGSLHCTAKRPNCPACPVNAACRTGRASKEHGARDA
jgi:A/G-specific adenine glycosylase